MAGKIGATAATPTALRRFLRDNILFMGFSNYSEIRFTDSLRNRPPDANDVLSLTVTVSVPSP